MQLAYLYHPCMAYVPIFGKYTIHGFYGIYLNFLTPFRARVWLFRMDFHPAVYIAYQKVLPFMRPRWSKPLEEILRRLIGSVSTFVPFMIVLYFLVKLLGRDHPTAVVPVPVYDLLLIDQIAQLHILL